VEVSVSDDQVAGGAHDLIATYHRHVQAIVDKLMRAMSLPAALKDDFMAAGALGLVEAASRFDASRGHDFRAFAFLRIRGAVIDHIRASCELSGRAYRMYRALAAAHQMREQIVTGHPDRYAARTAANETAQALELLSQSAVAFALYGVAAGSDATASATPEAELYKKQRSKKLREMVATLPEKERIIIEQHYFHDLSLVEIAHKHAGLSKSWVSRLHDRALSMLRDKMVADPERAVGVAI
jgi:RNA polymerase sigma factor for flagellar operon FliA